MHGWFSQTYTLLVKVMPKEGVSESSTASRDHSSGSLLFGMVELQVRDRCSATGVQQIGTFDAKVVTCQLRRKALSQYCDVFGSRSSIDWATCVRSKQACFEGSFYSRRL